MAERAMIGMGPHDGPRVQDGALGVGLWMQVGERVCPVTNSYERSGEERSFEAAVVEPDSNGFASKKDAVTHCDLSEMVV